MYNLCISHAGEGKIELYCLVFATLRKTELALELRHISYSKTCHSSLTTTFVFVVTTLTLICKREKKGERERERKYNQSILVTELFFMVFAR